MYGEIGCLERVLDFYRIRVFQKDSQFNNVMRSTLEAVSTMLKVSGCETASEFEFDLDSMNERLLGRLKLYRHKVQIATVHDYKGKEADSVYIWNDSEEVFPIKDVIEGTDAYEEERRIHYIACTRAKKVSTILYLRGRQGAFVDEMDLSNAEKVQNVVGGAVEEMVGNEEEKGNLRGFVKRALAKSDDSLDNNLSEGTDDVSSFDEVLGSRGIPVVKPPSITEYYEEKNSRVGDDSDDPNGFWGME